MSKQLLLLVVVVVEVVVVVVFFSNQLTLIVFHWSLSHSKSPQVSRTLVSILAVLNNAVDWVVSTRPPTPKSSTPFNPIY